MNIQSILEKWNFTYSSPLFETTPSPEASCSGCSHDDGDPLLGTPRDFRRLCLFRQTSRDFDVLRFAADVLGDVESALAGDVRGIANARPFLRRDAEIIMPELVLRHASGRNLERVVEDALTDGILAQPEEAHQFLIMCTSLHPAYSGGGMMESGYAYAYRSNYWPNGARRMSRALFGRVSEEILRVPLALMGGPGKYIQSGQPDGWTFWHTPVDAWARALPEDDEEVVTNLSVLAREMPLLDALEAARALR